VLIRPRHLEHGVLADFEVIAPAARTHDGAGERGLIDAVPDHRLVDMHGDDLTGATTFRIVRELDAGPVFGVLTEPVLPTDTAGELLSRLSIAGAELLVATMDGIESGELEARPQPSDGMSVAAKLTPADAEVRWSQPAAAVSRQIRACTPAPGAWTTLDGHRVKLWPVDTAVDAEPLAPGEVRVRRDRAHGDQVLVGTGTAAVRLHDVQPDGSGGYTEEPVPARPI